MNDIDIEVRDITPTLSLMILNEKNLSGKKEKKQSYINGVRIVASVV